MIRYRFHCDTPTCSTSSVEEVQQHPEGWARLQLTVRDKNGRYYVSKSDLCQTHTEEAKSLAPDDKWCDLGGSPADPPWAAQQKGSTHD